MIFKSWCHFSEPIPLKASVEIANQACDNRISTNIKSSSRSSSRSKNLCWFLALCSIFALLSETTINVNAQCPWPRTPHHASLHSDCVCGYSNVRRLSVQCSPVGNFTQLLEVLHSPSVQRLPIDLLYVNNATRLRVLPKNAFAQLDIRQIHLANTRLETIERSAFAGLEDRLLSLTLQGTGLREVPVAEFRSLRSLRTLDLSQNRLRRVRADTFGDLRRLATLRLAHNPDLKLDRDAFIGLERTLKNLNLKAIGAKTIPDAVRNLTELAFLDLAQNRVEEIAPRVFERLHSLTALSLERNLIRTVHADAFVGLSDSLSSLSLLNNLLADFPQSALSKLTGLRVLDLGFNAIRQLPDDAFRANTLLTLLALDGNPLKTISLRAFEHLNSTLRGISVGGKLFECDCKIRWLAEWANEYNLQITSRERNPQFCAKPNHLRNKQFTHIDFNDFMCAPIAFSTPAATTTTTTSTTTTTMATPLIDREDTTPQYPIVHYEHKESSTTTTTTTTTTTASSPKPESPTTRRIEPKQDGSSSSSFLTIGANSHMGNSNIRMISIDQPSPPPGKKRISGGGTGSNGNKPKIVLTTPKNWNEIANKSTSTVATSEIESTQNRSTQKPKSVTLIVGQGFDFAQHPSNTTFSSSTSTAIASSPKSSILSNGSNNNNNNNNGNVNKFRHRIASSSSSSSPKRNDFDRDDTPLRLSDAIYRNHSVWLRWETAGTSSAGRSPNNNHNNNNNNDPPRYQVLYRYFGSKEFHKSEPISGDKNSYTFAIVPSSRSIPPNELIIVCVRNLDLDWMDREDAAEIPISQCRELSLRESNVQPRPPAPLPPIIFGNRPPPQKGNTANTSTNASGNSGTNLNTSLSAFYPSLKRLNDIDKIVIAISAAVCIFIVLSVIVFSCCFYRSVSRESPLRTVLASSNAKCLSTKSLSPITKSSIDHHEWETVSVYSSRSIPRARIAAASASQHHHHHYSNQHHPHYLHNHQNHHHNPPLPPPPTISGTIRSHISNPHQHQHNHHHNHQPPQQHFVGNNALGNVTTINRYFGSTLPNNQSGKSNSATRTAWFDANQLPLAHHYSASTNHLPATVVSYGTTVTASGGCPPPPPPPPPPQPPASQSPPSVIFGGYYSPDNNNNNKNNLRQNANGTAIVEQHGITAALRPRLEYVRQNESKSSTSSAASNAIVIGGQRRQRNSHHYAHHHHHNQQQQQQQQQSHHRSKKSRSQKTNAFATSTGQLHSGSSYNRLLLSSSSNSFQSQNDYDSDNGNWNATTAENGYSGGGGGNNGIFGTNGRMNDNEVDIYVDQNYARRFV